MRYNKQIMVEYFPGFGPESADGDDDESQEKKASKKAERTGSKERKAEDKHEKRDRDNTVPLEKLAADETSVIAAELARLRAEAARQELTDAPKDSTEESEASAVAEFDEALQNNLEDGQSLDEALENAEAVVAEHLDSEAVAESDELDDTLVSEVEEDISAETITEDDVLEDDTTDLPITTHGRNGGGTGGTTTSARPTPSPGGAGHGSGGSGRGGGAGAGAGGGAGGQGPPPVVPPAPQGPAPGGNVQPQPAANSAPNLNAPAAANTAPDQATEQQSMAPYLLTGGLIGYLVGRRRGRIKTEKRLLPVQKSLEKEVSNLEKQIILREEKIRKLSQKQAEAKPLPPKLVVERKPVQGITPTLESVVMRAVSRNKERSRSEKAETVSRQPRVASEKLGKLVFKRETNSGSQSEQRQKPVEIMTVAEVLVIAKQIKVEQIDVKRLYETGRLDDKGVRRVVRAFLNGEAYKRVLQEELRSPDEISLERDPMRPTETTHINQRGSQPAQSEYSTPPTTTPLANEPKTSASSAQPYAQAQRPKTKKSGLTKPVLTTLVVVAASLVIIFLLARG